MKVLWARLSALADTAVSSTHLWLYSAARQVAGVEPDLAFMPQWKGHYTGQEARSFELIGISNAIVQELVNLPAALKTAGIPLFKRERMLRDDLPLVILGGANALTAHVAWLGASGGEAWVDGVFVGEGGGEQGVRALLASLLSSRGLPKAERLKRLRELPGFFEPEQLFEAGAQVTRYTPRSLGEWMTAAPLMDHPDLLGSAALQISEGCACFCSFCAESWERRPYRERSPQELRELALSMKARLGLDSIELHSFNFNMHSGIRQILWDCAGMFRRVGLKSQRFDWLAHDFEMLKIQAALDKTSLTCGMEGISERLRAFLRKSLSEKDLKSGVEKIFRLKSRELKVFLIATGHENDEDLQEFSELLKWMQEQRRILGAQTRVIFSMTPLVRFPGTPLEFEASSLEPESETLAQILKKTAGRVRSAGFEYREAAGLAEAWVSQVLLRADSPQFSQLLLTVLQESGFVYKSAFPAQFARRLYEKMLEAGIDLQALLGELTESAANSKPWAMIASGVDRAFLHKEFITLKASVSSLASSPVAGDGGYCLARSWCRPAPCFACGACNSADEKKKLTLATQAQGNTADAFKERRLLLRKSLVSIFVRAEIKPGGEGTPASRPHLAQKIAAQVLSRALDQRGEHKAYERIVEGYQGFVRSTWIDEKRWEQRLPVCGIEIFEFHWDARELDRARLKALLESCGYAEVASLDPGPCLMRCQSQNQPSLEPYLKALSLKYTLRKVAAGNGFLFEAELAPASLKKNIVKSARWGVVAELQPSEKFKMSDLLASNETLRVTVVRPE